MGVYLLCGEHDTKPNVHYVGYTGRDWMDRVREHQGKQCKSTRGWVKEGYTFRLAHWLLDGTLKHETGLRRCLKKVKYACCPRCGTGEMPGFQAIAVAALKPQ